MRKLVKILVFFSCICNFAILSETILLKNTKSIKGKIKNQSINSIIVDIKGTIQEIPKELILKIVYRDLTPEEEKKIRDEEEGKITKDSKPTKAAKIDKPEEKLIPSKETSTQENANNSKEKNIKNKIPKKKNNSIGRLSVAFRSALLPGWGQYLEKRNLAAFGYPFLLVGVGVLGFNEHKRYKNSLKDYNNMASPPLNTQILFATIEEKLPSGDYHNYRLYNQKATVRKHYQHARNFGYALLAIYVLNIIDAFSFYDEKVFSENKAKGFFLDHQLIELAGQPKISNSKASIDQVYTFGYSLQF